MATVSRGRARDDGAINLTVLRRSCGLERICTQKTHEILSATRGTKLEIWFFPPGARCKVQDARRRGDGDVQ